MLGGGRTWSVHEIEDVGGLSLRTERPWDGKLTVGPLGTETGPNGNCGTGKLMWPRTQFIWVSGGWPGLRGYFSQIGKLR